MNVAGPYSVAGQWGSERKQPLPVLNTSSSREDYGVHNKRELERASRNPFARFKGIKDSNPIILTYNNRPTHMDSLHDEGMKDIDPLMTTTARAMNEWRERSFSNTHSKKFSASLRSQDIPQEFTKSGRQRMSTSLIGEKLSLSDEPSKNTLVQRSWLYSDDPCVMYRLYGHPQVQDPQDESKEYGGLNTRVHTTSMKHSSHGRRAVLTGNILTKGGSSKAGIFLDDYDRIKRDKGNEYNGNDNYNDINHYENDVPYNGYENHNHNHNHDHSNNHTAYQYTTNVIRR